MASSIFNTNTANGGGILGGAIPSPALNSNSTVTGVDISSAVQRPTQQYVAPDPYAAYGGAAGYRQAMDTQAQYGDQINQLNGQMGQLDGQLGVGLGNIANSYNLSNNRLAEQTAAAERNYGLQKQDNTSTYTNNRNSINTGVRANNNALQRLLGMAGAGNSSAAYEQAPYAAALQGSQQLNGAQQTYAKNAQGLDINWQDTQRSAKNSREDLDRQKFQQENGLKSSIASTRASLLDKIAGLNLAKAQAGGADYRTAAAGVQGQRDQVNGLLSQITQLGNQYANPVIQTGDVKFNAPELAQYQLDNRAQISQQGGSQAGISPAYASLLNQRRDEFGNIVG